MAKRLNATYLMDEKKFQEAIDDIQDLVHERPNDPWVLRGRAIQTVAQCHEQMGDWRQAEVEYLAFITKYREAPDVTTGKLLARLIPKFSEEALKYIYDKFPEDLVKAAVQLPKEEQEALFDRFPKLRQRTQKALEESLKSPPRRP